MANFLKKKEGLCMVKLARLIVLVQDPDHKIITNTDAKVEGKLETEKEFKEIPFNKRLQRFIRDELKPDSFEVRVSGQGDYSQEACTIDLVSGDNHIHVMLGKPGMLSLKLAGMNYYFEPHEEELILSVKGAKDASEVVKVLEKKDLKYEILLDDNKKIKHHNLLIKISIGKNEDAKLTRKKLQKIMKKKFSKLTAKLAAPIYKNNKFSQGITNELVICFKPNVSFNEIKEFVKKYDLDLKYRILFINNGVLFSLKGTPDYQILRTIAELEKSELVIYAQPNLIQQLQKHQYNPNDFLFPELSHLILIRCDYAWQTLDNRGINGGNPDITIAVLDVEGIDPTHPDLTGQLSDGSEKMIAYWDFRTNPPTSDFDFHGTMCAGSATARMDNAIGIVGVAPNCHLIGGTFESPIDSLDVAHMWLWMAGFPYQPNPNLPPQLDKGADIISNSWGPLPDIPRPTDAILRDAFDFLTTYGRGGRGCLVCCSLGNYGYMLVDNHNPFSADEKTLGIGSSINCNPTETFDNSKHADHNNNKDGLRPVVDTRSFYSPYGMTVDLVSPSHTAYLDDDRSIDPILACSAQDQGNWPANQLVETTTTQPLFQGNIIINVANSTGFQVGKYALFNTPGNDPIETKKITAVNTNQLTISPGIYNPEGYPNGTVVISGPNDYLYYFGGTSHSCPTVAGAAALLLSVKPDLTWIELRDILRNSAEEIDQTPSPQWEDLNADGNPDFSQWYGYGRLNVQNAINEVFNLNQRANVVIRDNIADTGAVPSQGWLANSPDIWVRQTNDPIPNLLYNSDPSHQNPIYGQDNYLYLRVKNIGDASASLVYVRAYITHYPGLDFQYPEDWQPTQEFGEIPNLSVPGTYLIGEVKIEDLHPNVDTIVKMRWKERLVPRSRIFLDGNLVKWYPCILAEVSPHSGPDPIDTTVKGNNNLAHRNVTIEYRIGGTDTAVVAGTHNERGLHSVIIDRSRLPQEYELFLYTTSRYMKIWKRLTKGVRDFRFPALRDDFRDRREEELLTSIESVKITTYNSKLAVSIDHSVAPISLPLNLEGNTFIPILVGIRPPRTTTSSGSASIRITQRRNDQRISTGYEILMSL